jgi:2-isopropylmalate synthase
MDTARMRRKMQIEFSRVIQQITDATGREITSAEIWLAFKAEYIDQVSPLAILEHSEHSTGEKGQLRATMSDGVAEHAIFGEGNGPIDAFVLAINKHFDLAIRILDYEEHAVGSNHQCPEPGDPRP